MHGGGYWKSAVARAVAFFNALNGFVANNVQNAIEEARPKAGSVAAGSFSLTPKKATVTFVTAYPAGTNYAVKITGSDGRSWTAESITVSGFTINANANLALTGPVFWETAINWNA